jgi:hypothetical protein
MALRSNACLLDPFLDKLLTFASDAADFALQIKLACSKTLFVALYAAEIG